VLRLVVYGIPAKGLSIREEPAPSLEDSTDGNVFYEGWVEGTDGMGEHQFGVHVSLFS
jgi:hypothetical protein